MPAPQPDASKGAWREWAREVRSGLDWGTLSAAVVDGIRAWVLPDVYLTVLVYLPMGHEIDLKPLLEVEDESETK